jgi:hypothetical protein
MTVIAHCRPTGTVRDMDATFTAEVQLGGPVHAWLETFDGRRDVVHELDAGCGVPDLVAGRRLTGAYPAQRPTVSDQLQLRVLQMCQGGLSESDLRQFAPHGWRALRKRAVEPLMESGLLTSVGSGTHRSFVAQVGVEDPYVDLVAVELKLRDWRRAVGQAVRYRVFAERSYVALPAQRVSLDVVREATRAQVGLLAVDGALRVEEVVTAPFAAALQPARRRWASECTTAALFSPVFRPAGAPLFA